MVKHTHSVVCLTWVQIQALLLMGCGILDKSLNLSELHFPHLENGDENALLDS